MLVSVPVHDVRDLDAYREPAGDEAVERLREVAEPLRGCRIVNISSTAFGGGVAELLPTQIAIMRDLGIEAEWQLIEGSEDFFSVTKLVHNALQGAGVPWTQAMEETYLARVEANALRFDDHADIVLVHDPQPVAMLTFLEAAGRRSGSWAWRCHIDLSSPMETVWGFFAPHVGKYDAAVFTLDEYVRETSGPQVAIIPPSIDPLSLKNAAITDEHVREIVSDHGVDPDRPIITQVSRFDPWKDPLGVIDAYRAISDEFPEAQLALIGSMAHDDPEGWHYLEQAEAHRAGDPDIHILTNLQGIGALDVNAFQRISTAVLQKSIREGFGLTASEAMWKGRPLIAGDAGGLRLQVDDGETGFLVDTVETCAERLRELLRDAALRARMGEAGKQRVRERFLSLREVEDHLRLFASLL